MVGDQIRKLRKKKGIRQRDMARRLGVSQTHISMIENNKSGISMNLLEEVCNLLDADLLLLERDIDERITQAVNRELFGDV